MFKLLWQAVDLDIRLSCCLKFWKYPELQIILLLFLTNSNDNTQNYISSPGISGEGAHPGFSILKLMKIG